MTQRLSEPIPYFSSIVLERALFAVSFFQAVSRDDSHTLEGRGIYGVQRAVPGEDEHAQPGKEKVQGGQADSVCLQKRRDLRRRNCQVQSRGRAEEAALHGLSVFGQGFNQLHRPSQTRRGGSLESYCGEAAEHREAPHPGVAHSAVWIEDGTRDEGDQLPHQG